MENILPIVYWIAGSCGVAFAIWFLIRKNFSSEAFKTVRSIIDIVRFFAKLFIKDKQTAVKFDKIADFIALSWIEVENSKKSIKSEMIAEGWNENDLRKYHDALTDEAVRIVRNLASQSGTVLDDVTEQLARMAVKFICNFLKKPGSSDNIENEDFVVVDLEGIPDKAGGFGTAG